LIASRVSLNMAFDVTIKLNTTSVVNLQEPSQSVFLLSHDVLALERKLSDFRAFRISDTELCKRFGDT